MVMLDIANIHCCNENFALNLLSVDRIQFCMANDEIQCNTPDVFHFTIFIINYVAVTQQV